MIHVCTIHWKDDRWVDVQLRYLERFVSEPFRVYAFLNRLETDHRHKYFFASDADIKPHAPKLNLLADVVASRAESDDDWIMFVDGDAFPIADVVPFARETLAEVPLLAIQRKENMGDQQPHPCFCMTTVGFWKEIRGDWDSGYTWENAYGKMETDVGGNLLGKLRERGAEWRPLLRSNRTDLHPLWFGVYGDLVYHHGAGFRRPVSRLDWHNQRITGVEWLDRVLQRLRLVRGHFKRKFAVPNRELGERVYRLILEDPDFFRVFTEGESERLPGLAGAAT